jgi:putative oxidoreductase
MNRLAPFFAAAGRLLLALLFAPSGIAKLQNPAGTAQFMASVGLPDLPLLAQATGLFELAAGLALLAGWQARGAAFALAAFTLLANLLFHAYWALPVAEQSMAQLLFMKNLAVVGGLFFIAAFGAGALSLDARARAT